MRKSPLAFALAFLGASQPPHYHIYGLHFATEGASKRAVLFDAGYYRQKFLDQSKPVPYERPSDAIQKVGLTPDAVTDIIISHVHWDHLDGADLFPKAHIWIQKAEYEHYIDVKTRAGTVVLASDDAVTYQNLEQHISIWATFAPGDSTMNLEAQDRMRRIASDPKLIFPGHDPAIFTRFPAPGNGVARIE
jgi:glyoxylase-like metal-dependent hydrolase (beta-lactamase superfamily II)